MMEQNKKFSFLIIDDSNIILQALKSFFEDYNIEVYTCSDGLEGIDKAIKSKPDLIFLDLLMPNFDGIKMLQVKSVIQEIKEIPVVVISANTNKKNVLTAIELGANKVISKPFQKEVIIKVVREILGEEIMLKPDQNSENKIKMDNKLENALFEDVKDKLIKLFLETFSEQKNSLQRALEKRNDKEIGEIIHNLKGVGGTIGASDITELAKIIEEKEIKSDLDWFFIQVKCEQLFKRVREIENIYNQKHKVN